MKKPCRNRRVESALKQEKRLRFSCNNQAQFYERPTDKMCSLSDINDSLVDRVGEVASTLATIPLLPALVDLAVQDPLASVTSCQELSQRKDNVSLLDWLHLRNSNDSFHKLSQMCSRGIQQVCDIAQKPYKTVLIVYLLTNVHL